MFYEVYRDHTAVTNHKLTPHYKRWNDFRDSGGVERQQNTVAEGVYIGDHASAPGSPASPQPAGSPGSSKHGGNNYDVVREHPRRGQTAAPEGFGHPRGLAEEPIRPGTLSNFGRGGSPRQKRIAPSGISQQRDHPALLRGRPRPEQGTRAFRPQEHPEPRRGQGTQPRPEDRQGERLQLQRVRPASGRRLRGSQTAKSDGRQREAKLRRNGADR